MTEHVVNADSLACAEWFARTGIVPALVVTSPPYNANRDYGRAFADRRPVGEYVAFLARALRATDGVLAPGGFLVVNLRDVKLSHGRTRDAGDVIREALPAYERVARVTWRKGPTVVPAGRFREVGLLERTEPVLFFRKPGPRRDQLLIAREPLPLAWDIPSVRDAEGHPCPFPEAVPARAIAACSLEGDWVFDPFGGTGTTALAARRAGRHAVSMDVSPEFCALARARLGAEPADPS